MCLELQTWQPEDWGTREDWSKGTGGHSDSEFHVIHVWEYISVLDFDLAVI